MNPKHTPTRRHFLKTTSALAAGAWAFPQVVKAETLGLNGRTSANSKVNIGIIGCGNRGFSGTTFYAADERVRLAGFCDPYDVHILKYKHRMISEYGADCRAPDYVDFRELLEAKDIDAVHIATPDHWHVPMALAAARAGKDIYLEKPLGLSIEQTLAARAITEKYGRVFQYGTQNRSLQQVRLAVELALNGALGKIRRFVVWAPPGVSGYSATPVLPVPKGLDYELWLGPAPVRPFCHDRFFLQDGNKAIYHIYDYAIGFIAGWGAHPVDQLQWYADHAGLGIPVRYEGNGAIPAEGLFDTVTHYDLTCTYANGLQLRFLDTDTWKAVGDPDLPKSYHGTLLIGENGWVNYYRGGWAFSSDAIRQRAREPMEITLRESTDHCRNFVDGILARKQPVSDMSGAVGSDLICHLSDIAIRTGRPITWDPERETITGDPEARARMHRDMRAPYGLEMGA